jgi:hypothetical protein
MAPQNAHSRSRASSPTARSSGPVISSSSTQNSSKSTVTDSKDLLMVSLAKFYSSKTHIQSIIHIIEGKSDISLRLIDWFVTNYSKKYSTIITKTIEKNIVHFNVYLSYRSQLKAYSKQQFDPFRRRDRIKFFYEKDKWIETTIGQLNFFRWIVQNDILEYITLNIERIETDMIQSQKENHVKKLDTTKQQLSTTEKQTSSSKEQQPMSTMNSSSKSKKKRIELSKSFVKNMNRYDGTRKISFD